MPSVSGARALIVDDWELGARTVQEALSREGIVPGIARTRAEALAMAEVIPFDLIVVSLSLADEDPLQLVSSLRASDAAHDTPMLLVAEPEERARVLRGFALGASDWLTMPVDENELRVRARNQIRRKFYQDRLRLDLGTALELALTDPLTGLYNQRYLRRHLTGLLETGAGRALAVLMVDIDHFKSVNDRYGHATGDQALREVATTLRANTRVFDSVARYGGEEFVVVMPGSHLDDATAAAERLRAAAQEIVLETAPLAPPTLSISIGVACSGTVPTTVDALLMAADQALYAAKRGGRNRVEVAPSSLVADAT
ncbi:MAG: diguanylate cyclase, partial [Acetobacteraceae bacterium]